MSATALQVAPPPGQRRAGWLQRVWPSLNPAIPSWQGRSVWIVGASSGIGLATARLLHERGATVYMSARNAEALAGTVEGWPNAIALPLDARDLAAVRATGQKILQRGPLDLVFYCAGHYRAMRATAFDGEEMRLHHEINYAACIHVLETVLPAFVQRGQGHVSVAASVAGYRGLPNGLAYGPTKAALIHLAEVLYLDLHDLGIGVSVVNPGFVQTPLTAQNAFHMPALLTPEQAASSIVEGWERGRFEIHFPRRFTMLMKLLRCLPFRVHAALVRRWTGL